MDIISRKKAKEQGLKHYFTGKPCKRKHITKRFVSDLQCAECKKESFRNWYKENPEKDKDRKQRYCQNNSEKVKKGHQRWKRDNKGRVNTNNAKRKASKLQRTPTWANHEDILQWYELAEVLSRSGVKFNVDHIVPLQGKNVSGLHVENNLQVIPAHLNFSKLNKWDWITQQ